MSEISVTFAVEENLLFSILLSCSVLSLRSEHFIVVSFTPLEHESVAFPPKLPGSGSR